nr:endonuclease-reverse transcriptase HmRTE-e01 [Haemonchus contortus]
MISLVKGMYDGSTTAMRTVHGQIGAIDVTAQDRQGSALSPFLFLLTMDVITEELMDGPLKTILYADDIALLAESKEKLQDKLQKWQKKTGGEWTPAEREEDQVPQLREGHGVNRRRSRGSH